MSAQSLRAATPITASGAERSERLLLQQWSGKRSFQTVPGGFRRLLPFIPGFDPTFVILAMGASVEAIFLSTFVLITQNRMQMMADRRAELALQISLLAEHEVTRVIQLVSAIADRLGLEKAKPPELSELEEDVRPEAVLERIDEVERAKK